MERSLLDIVLIMIGTGTFLFLGSACVAAGFHMGLRIGAWWFGPIQITQTHHGVRGPSDGEGGR